MAEDSKASWLTEDFLTKILQGEEVGNEIEVVSWKCESAVSEGINYLSEVFRVIVNYRIGNDHLNTSLIVKVALPLGHEGRTLCDSFHGFRREIKMYNEIFPEISKILPWPNAPKAFPSPSPDIIVLEDLREQGYKLHPRGTFLDFLHCKEILAKISTFHAISVRLHQEFPELVESVGRDTRFTDESLELEEFWKEYLGTFATFKECVEYAAKICRKIEHFYPSVIEMFKPSKCLNVLTHDDLWLNNLLFSYDQSGNIVDSKVIDFQSPRYCSFAADLIVFWWTSVDVGVRDHHQEELFEIYRQNLNKTLEELNCAERVSKAEFDSEIQRFSMYSLRPVSEIFGSGNPLLPTVLRQMERFGVFSG